MSRVVRPGSLAGYLGSSSHLALALSVTAKTTWVSVDRPWSLNDWMCGLDGGCCTPMVALLP